MRAPFWISAFLDQPAATHDEAVAFWAGVTGYDVSPPRGETGEFATLVPATGDDHLRVQRVGEAPARVHLDLHVVDPRAEADRLAGLGAREVADHGHVVMTSPGGLTLCLVTHPASVRPAPARWSAGGTAHTSLVDQVCLDVPGPAYEREVGFWQALTGWEPQRSSVSTDFSSLARPDGHPIRLLFQRLGEDAGPARAHLDLATSDRAAETARHRALGAEVEGVHGRWTVLRDPAGRRYCLTDRLPETGLLPPA